MMGKGDENKDTPAQKAASGGKSGSNSLWGGRFGAGPSDVMSAINASIDVDIRLAMHDIAGSRAHARMLAEQGIIDTADAEAILTGLDQIESAIVRGAFEIDAALEDIHMHIEARLSEIAGDSGKKLHTARSRNDQVATDLRLWLRDAAADLITQIRQLQHALLDQAGEHADTVMPGFTHLQTAQPVTLGHHFLAYVEMFDRDAGRLADARRRLNESPLGAGALAGTGFDIDREATAKELGFDRPMANSLDAVSARDFALEYLAALSICAVHLSRLAEEIVIWASAPFHFISLPDDYSTGSSIMPQKRNPDAAELVRGKAGRIIGALNALLIVMKGLPLAYQKDMQEDKEPVFDAGDTLALCLSAMHGMIATLGVDRDAMRKAAAQGFSTATDLADWLVREAGLPFREAHHITGRIVARAEEKGCDLADVPIEDMQAIEAKITGAVYDVLSVEASVASRKSFGGTAPERVREQIERWRKELGK